MSLSKNGFTLLNLVSSPFLIASKRKNSPSYVSIPLNIALSMLNPNNLLLKGLTLLFNPFFVAFKTLHKRQGFLACSKNPSSDEKTGAMVCLHHLWNQNSFSRIWSRSHRVWLGSEHLCGLCEWTKSREFDSESENLEEKRREVKITSTRTFQKKERLEK